MCFHYLKSTNNTAIFVIAVTNRLNVTKRRFFRTRFITSFAASDVVIIVWQNVFDETVDQGIKCYKANV